MRVLLSIILTGFVCLNTYAGGNNQFVVQPQQKAERDNLSLGKELKRINTSGRSAKNDKEYDKVAKEYKELIEKIISINNAIIAEKEYDKKQHQLLNDRLADAKVKLQMTRDSAILKSEFVRLEDCKKRYKMSKEQVTTFEKAIKSAISLKRSINTVGDLNKNKKALEEAQFNVQIAALNLMRIKDLGRVENSQKRLKDNSVKFKKICDELKKSIDAYYNAKIEMMKADVVFSEAQRELYIKKARK